MTLRQLAERRPDRLRDVLSQRAEQGPMIRNPVPDWLRPENDSVLDSMPEKAAKAVLRFFGAADPNDQVLGVMAPLEIPAKTLQEIAKRTLTERVGPTVRALKGAMSDAVRGRTMPAPLGRLDRTLEIVNGDLRLKPEVVDRLGVFHEVGGNLPTAANWDGADHADLLTAFGGDRGAAEVYGQQWGATSPNTDVLRNTYESEISQLYQLTHGGEPIPLSLAQFADPANGGKQLITSAEAKIPNIGRALRGEQLSGPKVREMGNYAAGRPSTPIDVHTMYAMGSKHSKLEDHDMPALRAWLGQRLGLPASHAGSLNSQQAYDMYASTIEDALRQIDSTASHNRNFGQMWEGVKGWKGQPSVGGFIDVLRRQDLLRPGAMLDPNQLRNALKRAGITTPFAVAIMKAMQDESDQDR